MRVDSQQQTHEGFTEDGQLAELKDDDEEERKKWQVGYEQRKFIWQNNFQKLVLILLISCSTNSFLFFKLFFVMTECY